VNEWYVVTAGHCVARARASQVRVTLGEYVLKSSAEPLPGRTYGVSHIKVHPYFKFTPQADREDIGLTGRERFRFASQNLT
jgi:transmembrane serine protease 6